jgi:HEPN domain-containing protein
MPLEDAPDSAAAWIRYARSDLAVASGPHADAALPAVYCFHAQQAVEKSIKAVYVAHSIEFEFIHDIRRLLDALSGVDIPDEVYQSARLTPYAVMTRYPGELAHLTNAHTEEAVALATIVVDWAEEMVRGVDT